MKDAKALYHIQQAIGKIISPRIMAATKSKEAWEILKNEFQGSENMIAVKLQTLWREFDNLMMKEGESIQNFFLRVFTVLYQIKSCGDIIQGKRVVEKVLRSLSIKYHHVVAAIEESKNLSTLCLHELMGSLQVHEERMNRFSEQPLEQDFQSKTNMLENKDGEKKKQNQGSQFQRAQSNRGHGRGGNKCTQYNARGKSKSESCCIICKKTNHETKDCYFKKCTRCKNSNHHLQKDCQFRKRDETKFPVKGESSNQLFYPGMNTQQDAQDTWYNDSRCTNHMTGNKSSFASLDEGLNSKVKLGDGKFQNIEGKGTIAVQTKGAMEASTSSEVNSQIPANSFIPPFVPSEAEVESTISGLSNFFQSEAGSEFGSLPLISSHDGSNLQSVEGMTFRKAFELIETVKPLQNLVKAATINEGMWEAFLNVDEVQIFLLPTGANRAATITSDNLQTQSSNNSEQQSLGANTAAAITSSNPQTQGGANNNSNLQMHNSSHNHQWSSGANNVVANPSSNPQTPNIFHSHQQSLAQQESFNSGKWEKILLQFFRIRKSIFNAFKYFQKFYYGNQPTSEDCTLSVGDSKDKSTKLYLEVAFILSNVLRLSILMLRRLLSLRIQKPKT